MNNEKYKIILNSFLIIVSTIALTSCAPKEEAETVKASDDGVFQDEVVSAEVVSREAVFVYGEQANNNPQELILTTSSQPLLIGQSYVRLVGVVCGDKKTAVVEVGGRGSVVEEGATLNDYKVVSIEPDQVLLVRMR